MKTFVHTLTALGITALPALAAPCDHQHGTCTHKQAAVCTTAPAPAATTVRSAGGGSCSTTSAAHTLTLARAATQEPARAGQAAPASSEPQVRNLLARVRQGAPVATQATPAPAAPCTPDADPLSAPAAVAPGAPGAPGAPCEPAPPCQPTPPAAPEVALSPFSMQAPALAMPEFSALAVPEFTALAVPEFHAFAEGGMLDMAALQPTLIAALEPYKDSLSAEDWAEIQGEAQQAMDEARREAEQAMREAHEAMREAQEEMRRAQQEAAEALREHQGEYKQRQNELRMRMTEQSRELAERSREQAQRRRAEQLEQERHLDSARVRRTRAEADSRASGNSSGLEERIARLEELARRRQPGLRVDEASSIEERVAQLEAALVGGDALFRKTPKVTVVSPEGAQPRMFEVRRSADKHAAKDAVRKPRSPDGQADAALAPRHALLYKSGRPGAQGGMDGERQQEIEKRLAEIRAKLEKLRADMDSMRSDLHELPRKGAR